jgi:agmatine deiminase
MRKVLLVLLLFSALLNAQTVQYTMPGEDMPHEGTWLQWPHNFTYPPYHQDDNESAFVEMVAALEIGEKVHIIVYDANEQTHVQQALTTASISLTNIDFFIHPNDDYWVRDNGPIFVYDANNNLTILDFGFNGWGGDTPYSLCDTIPSLLATDLNIPVIDLSGFVLEGGAIEIDGHGSVMLTRSSVTAADRNPNLTESQIENYMTTYLGLTNFIWLDGQFGGTLDITDMHIDGFAKFVDSSTIITFNNSDLSYWGLSNADIAALTSAINANGTPYTYVTLPLTQNDVVTTWGNNIQFKGSYTNYYVANTVVLVPTYNDPNDSTALSVIQSQYPNRTVVGIDSRNLYFNGGMVHCVTQQQPEFYYHVSTLEENNKNKKLVRVIDVLGRSVIEMENQILFYIFEDGTVEKKMIINE